MEEQDIKRIERIIKYIESTLLRKFGRISGDYLIDFILDKVEEYEFALKLNSDDILVSGASLNRASSQGLSSVSQSKHDYSKKVKRKNSPSINHALKI